MREKHREMKTTKGLTVYGRIMVGRELKEMKMSEIKLAPEEQTNTSTPRKTEESLFTYLLHSLSVSSSPSLSLSVCL